MNCDRDGEPALVAAAPNAISQTRSHAVMWLTKPEARRVTHQWQEDLRWERKKQESSQPSFTRT